MRAYRAVEQARQLIQQGKTTPAAAIEIAARAFGLNDRLVADYVLSALRGCDQAREVLWFQWRQAQGDETPEVSLMGDSSLSLFDYV